jgi:hypothetical protein
VKDELNFHLPTFELAKLVTSTFSSSGVTKALRRSTKEVVDEVLNATH